MNPKPEPTRPQQHNTTTPTTTLQVAALPWAAVANHDRPNSDPNKTRTTRPGQPRNPNHANPSSRQQVAALPSAPPRPIAEVDQPSAQNSTPNTHEAPRASESPREPPKAPEASPQQPELSLTGGGAALRPRRGTLGGCGQQRAAARHARARARAARRLGAGHAPEPRVSTHAARPPNTPSKQQPDHDHSTIQANQFGTALRGISALSSAKRAATSLQTRRKTPRMGTHPN